MDYITLNNGTKAPLCGIGTFMMQPDAAEEAVYNALMCGYRLIDTANAYMNEKAVGRGMKRSGVAREEIYLSTKLWPSVYTDADNAIDQTLRRLGTDYIDLLYLHQPAGDYVGAYKAMERAVKAGKVRSLGISNFEEPQIREILDACEIVPAFMQVEAHPYYPQTALKEYLKPMGTAIMAWYPLGHGDKSLVNEEVFTKLAESSISVDMIIQNVSKDGYTDISFTCPANDLSRAVAAIEDVMDEMVRAILIDIFKKLNYYGFDKQVYKECTNMISKTNQYHAGIILLWFMMINCFYLICAGIEILDVDVTRKSFYIAFIVYLL